MKRMKNTLTAVLTRTRMGARPSRSVPVEDFAPYTPLDFSDINRRANLFADLIERNFDQLSEILLQYESYEVVKDETDRTLDLLRNLDENKEYFQLRVNEIAAFLPRNQPLYAFTCFVIIPSLMASKVHFRVPRGMRHFFPELLKVLKVQEQFPNVAVSNLTRLEFLRARSALRIDPTTDESSPTTDAVIFTGTSLHAEQLRKVFDSRTLFISNGSGHNPVVISKDANIELAVEAVLALQFYNQGQDCAAPNAILIHKDVHESVLALLREKLSTIKTGQYRDKTCSVGPISDPKDLVRIQDFLIDHREWLDEKYSGIIHAHEAIVEPTMVLKPLRKGGNFKEIFAPVIFAQMYEQDADLALYFENPEYRPNAMYVTLYGTSAYVSSLVSKTFDGKVLHDKTTILHNMHLHALGMERGVRPYGGYGRAASSVAINGKLTSKPTLPQRDIYEALVKPILKHESADAHRRNLEKLTKIEYKNVEKLLRLIVRNEHSHEHEHRSRSMYIDLRAVKKIKGHDFAVIPEDDVYQLLENPNSEYISQLRPVDIANMAKLLTLLDTRANLDFDDFKTALYAIPVKTGVSDDEKKSHQREFFQHVYHLLFGKKSGPRLAQFFSDVNLGEIRELLNI